MKCLPGFFRGLGSVVARFKPSFIGTLLTILVVSFLSSLGFWQLHRAAEKQEWLQLAKQQEQKPAVDWRPGSSKPSPYQWLVLQGRYLPYTLLLDNQHANHQWGYHVFNALEIAAGQVILIDRGWVVGDVSRVVQPTIEIPVGVVSILGQVVYPSAKGLLLGELIEHHGSNLAVIERVDIKSISNLLHKKVYPFIIHLDKSAAFGYVRDWPIVSMPPERHYAYALQWFAMALVLFIIYLVLSLEKVKKNAEI